MRLLLTRPEIDSKSLAARLHENGIESLIEPLLAVHFEDGPPLNLDPVDALLLTSANGARAASRRMTASAFNKPVLCVGSATAKAATELGFQSVESADGDVETLAQLALQRLPTGSRCLHVAATHVAGDLGGDLSKGGLVYHREVLYSTATPLRLSLTALDAIKNGSIDGIVLFSPRTADVFLRLIARDVLTPHVRPMIAFCLSENIAKQVEGLHWAKIILADRPNEAALMGAILAEVP